MAANELISTAYLILRDNAKNYRITSKDSKVRAYQNHCGAV